MNLAKADTSWRMYVQPCLIASMVRVYLYRPLVEYVEDQLGVAISSSDIEHLRRLWIEHIYLEVKRKLSS